MENDELTRSKKLSCIPDDTTGLERIMLAAQGDLQRLLRYQSSPTRYSFADHINGGHAFTAYSLEGPST